MTTELPNTKHGLPHVNVSLGRVTSKVTPALVFIGFATLYILTRSISLDDFDSFNFARAIDRFDVQLNQPQPPGYPIYIFLARILDFFVRNHQLALTLLSALCGAVAILAFYALARDLEMGWAALPMAVTPLFWLSSSMALSDVPGLAFAIASVYLMHRAIVRKERAIRQPGADSSLDAQNDKRAVAYFVAGCATAGLAAGVRPQDAVVPLSVAILWGAPRLWQAKEGKSVGLGAAAFGVSCLLWAVPLALSFPNLGAAWTTMVSQSLYVGSTDSLFARPFTGANVLTRLAEFGSVFSAYFGGPRSAGLPAFCALLGALLVMAILCRRGRSLALAWLLPYFALMLLTLRPDDPRKVLPVLPPMLLLLGGISPRAVAAAACLGLAGWQAFVAAPLITALDTVPAPPEQAAAFLQANFSAGDTLVVAGQSYNAVRYRLPGFKAYLLEDLDPAAVNRDLDSGTYRNLVLLDKEGFTVPESYVGVGTRTFQRDELVLPKASTVWLAAYRPLDELRESDLALPAAPIHIGTPQDIRYLMDGWYRPEEIAGVPARWTAQSARLRFWTDHVSDASLQLIAAAYPTNQQLTINVNGQPAAQLTLQQGWAPYTVSVPARLLHAQSVNTIGLEHTIVSNAFQATGGQSLDRRPLAAAYSSFELTWKP